MKRYPAVLLLLILAFSACVSAGNLSQTTDQSPRPQPTSDSVFVSIKAINLSEDMSKILSTKNDELLILIYDYQESTTLGPPLFQQSMIMSQKDKAFNYCFEKSEEVASKTLLFLLIEQDFDRPIEQIDPVIRIEHQALLEAFKKRDYQQIKRFLGNEDLLGYKLIKDYQPEQPDSFKIKGVHKLDWYEYEVVIGRRK